MKSGKFTFVGHGRSDIAITLNDADGAAHTLVLGSTRRGRSSLIEAEAVRRGVSYEEAEKAFLPTEAEKEAAAEREKAAQAKRDVRIAAVREAYWTAIDPAAGEFSSLHDVLAVVCEREPTGDHVHRLFNMLPAELIGEGVKWGFTDTVVGDSIFEFVRENKAAVVAHVFAD